MYAQCEGKLVARQTMGPWEGQIVDDVPKLGEKDLELRWRGAKVPKSLWLQMLGFFRYAEARWKCEAQVRLYHDPATGEWKAAALPQWIATGMESDEIKSYELDAAKTELRNKALASVAGLTAAGTAHSHCNGTAFQSGKDRRDEISQPGLHVTYGRVSGGKIHLHGRVCLRKLFYPIHWADWFPDWSAETVSRVDDFEWEIPADADLSFPEEWLACCFEKPAPVPRWHAERDPFPGREAGWDWDQMASPSADDAVEDDMSEALRECEEALKATGDPEFEKWALDALREKAADPTETTWGLLDAADEMLRARETLLDAADCTVKCDMPAWIMVRLMARRVFASYGMAPFDMD